MTIKIKPLSVNQCWQGRRYKTPTYKQYERDVLLLLDNNLNIDKNADIILYIEVGLSSKLADIDNIAKPLIDILQKKYGFNDKNIMELHIRKQLVKKGDEFVKINFEYA